MENEKLRPCHCGDPRPVEAKISANRFIVACNSCPTHAIGSTAAEARENWNREVAPRGRAGKGN